MRCARGQFILNVIRQLPAFSLFPDQVPRQCIDTMIGSQLEKTGIKAVGGRRRPSYFIAPEDGTQDVDDILVSRCAYA